MEDSVRSEAGGDAAARAFEELRAEVALAHRAIAGLAAERSTLEVPDYSETLGGISRDVGILAKWMKTTADAPALQLTPDEMARQIALAAAEARRTDAANLDRARAAMERAAQGVRAALSSARTKEHQRRHNITAACYGVLLGGLLWAVIPGTIARTFPNEWHLPERLATLTLRTSLWDGGLHMLAAGDAEKQENLTSAIELVEGDAEAVRACERKAETSLTNVRCTVRLRGRRGSVGDHR